MHVRWILTNFTRDRLAARGKNIPSFNASGCDLFDTKQDNCFVTTARHPPPIPMRFRFHRQLIIDSADGERLETLKRCRPNDCRGSVCLMPLADLTRASSSSRRWKRVNILIASAASYKRSLMIVLSRDAKHGEASDRKRENEANARNGAA